MEKQHLKPLVLLLIIAILGFTLACEDDENFSTEELLFDYGTKPDTLPDFTDVNLYNTSSPLNTPIASSPEIDPNSTLLREAIS